MSLQTESRAAQPRQRDARRPLPTYQEDLIFTELDPRAVIDQLGGDNTAVSLTTFGSLREKCPKCARSHLRLVLRQENVRTAHLFCADCECCFDAHYATGASALTI